MARPSASASWATRKAQTSPISRCGSEDLALVARLVAHGQGDRALGRLDLAQPFGDVAQGVGLLGIAADLHAVAAHDPRAALLYDLELHRIPPVTTSAIGGSGLTQQVRPSSLPCYR